MKLYFDPRGSYWVKTSDDRFISLDKSDAKQELDRHGLADEKYEPNLTKAESVLWRARHFGNVKYSGPVAGFRAGPLDLDSGERVLVTSESRFWKVKPKTGRITFFEQVVETLFDGGHDHALSWLSCAVKSLERGDFSPAPMLALVGDAGCGKSFFQYFITELLGGRVAKPYAWLAGRTNFNEDLAQAEHLSIEDESASTDIRTRRTFGAGIKQLAVNRDLHVNGKGKLALTLPTFRRITASLNADGDHILILPPMDDSIKDKVSLHRVKQAKLFDDRLENVAAIKKELPAIIAFLKSYRVPPALRCTRYGAVAWHDKEILATLEESQPETKLLSIIEAVDLVQSSEGWTGTATELEDVLARGTMASQAAKLFYYPAACGAYLSKLATRYPERIKFSRTGAAREWQILSPKIISAKN